jgi:hypothetical protein
VADLVAVLDLDRRPGDVWSYLRAVRTHPGFGLRLIVAACLVTGTFVRRGLVVTVLLVVGTLAVAGPVGWIRFRRTGRV